MDQMAMVATSPRTFALEMQVGHLSSYYTAMHAPLQECAWITNVNLLVVFVLRIARSSPLTTKLSRLQGQSLVQEKAKKLTAAGAAKQSGC